MTVRFPGPMSYSKNARIEQGRQNALNASTFVDYSKQASSTLWTVDASLYESFATSNTGASNNIRVTRLKNINRETVVDTAMVLWTNDANTMSASIGLFEVSKNGESIELNRKAAFTLSSVTVPDSSPLGQDQLAVGIPTLTSVSIDPRKEYVVVSHAYTSLNNELLGMRMANPSMDPGLALPVGLVLQKYSGGLTNAQIAVADRIVFPDGDWDNNNTATAWFSGQYSSLVNMSTQEQIHAPAVYFTRNVGSWSESFQRAY